jgi:hypothetical protein
MKPPPPFSSTGILKEKGGRHKNLIFAKMMILSK